MTIKDRALKMAIKEMTDAIPHLAIHFDDYFEAINACKEALEQPTVAELNDEYLRDTYVEGLNQPAQEPVAWMLEWKEGEFDYWHKHVDEDKLALEMWFDAIRLTDTEYKIYPLYTHPHQGQGLTDDEIIDLIIGKGWIDRLNDTYDLDHAKQEAIAMFDAIEQALKDKNSV